MKTIIFTIIGVIFSVYSYAQNDSIAVSQMKEMGVYYLEDNTLKQISPIIPEKSKVSNHLVKFDSTLEFSGEKSENILENTLEIYVFIPTRYSKVVKIKQFSLVKLTSKKGNRRLKIGTTSMLGGKFGTKNQTIEIKNLNDECYKLYTDEPMEEGCYGIYYNYGSGVPLKLYDFDIVNN